MDVLVSVGRPTTRKTIPDTATGNQSDRGWVVLLVIEGRIVASKGQVVRRRWQCF